jgi:membrane-associated phospholipid phosphatase
MPLFGFIHHLDDPFVFIFIVLVAALVVGLIKREYSLGLFIATALTFVVTYILKNIFKIPRPDGMVLMADGYRFPSLHAALTAAIVASLLLYAWRWCGTKPFTKTARAALATGAFGTIAVVNISRVALNVHQPIDVFAGSVIGITIAWSIHIFLLRNGAHH